jgi:hypothetical protein
MILPVEPEAKTEAAGDLAALLLQAFDAAGAEDGLVYVSVPITSGPRELSLMARLGASREDLRSTHRDLWLAEVVRPNEKEAVSYAARARVLFPQQLVVEPARLHVSAWSQADYGSFWETLIKGYALRLIATPDWAFSMGSRQEVDLAFRIGLPILSINGDTLNAAELAAADASARQAGRDLGFTDEEIERYLPPLRLPEPPETPDDRVAQERGDALVNRAFSEVFAWLRGERAFQLQHFDAAKDDAHTREGLGPETWWFSRLARYTERAQELGLDVPEGREALAKFAATAIALLESSVRVYGWLPTPGRRMGDHRDG